MKDWREMDEVFEELYNSVAQDEEIYEMDSISGSSWNFSTVSNSMGRRNSPSSPQIALEMLTQFSKPLNTGFRSCNREKTSKDAKENVSLVYKSRCRVDTKSSKTSHQEKMCVVEMQNGSDLLFVEPEFEDSYSTRCSDIEYSYEAVDGYESGVSTEQSDKRNLCKECRKLYKKASILKHTAKETPKKPEYSHWSSKFWMMMNRVPSQKRSSRKKKKQNRTLNSVVRKLRTSKPTVNLSLRCCRIHPFLKRSLRLSTTAKKQFHSFNGRQKRKRPRSPQKSFQKSKAERKKESSCGIGKRDAKKNYVFVLDSSEEEDTRLNVKRYKLLDETIERNCLQKPRENSPPPMADIVAPIKAWQEQNTSEHADIIDSPATLNEEALETFSQSFNTNSLDSDGSFDVAGPSVFAHVQEGSFKELLQRMNLGYVRSGIVRENQI